MSQYSTNQDELMSHHQKVIDMLIEDIAAGKKMCDLLDRIQDPVERLEWITRFEQSLKRTGEMIKQFKQ